MSLARGFRGRRVHRPVTLMVRYAPPRAAPRRPAPLVAHVFLIVSSSFLP